MNPDTIRISSVGALSLLGDRARLRLAARAGNYHLALDTPQLLLLRASEDENIRVPLCGEVRDAGSVAEALNIALMIQFKGEIWIQESRGKEDARIRVLCVENGVLNATRSNDPDDLLGAVVVQGGFASERQLEEALAAIGPEMRLGEALIANGAMTRETLFSALHRQAERVVFTCLTVRQGNFVFVANDAPSQASPQTLHLPLQALLLEGVQRIDEMSLFRHAIPNDDLVVFPTSDKRSRDLSPLLRQTLDACDGIASIDQIARLTGLSLFLVVKSVYALMQSGLVSVGSGQSQTELLLREMLADFNELLRKIAHTILTHGTPTSEQALSAALIRWWAGSEYNRWLSPPNGEALELDAEVLASEILDSGAAKPLSRAQRMISDVAAFAFFLATTLLPREHEKRLSREVGAGLRSIRRNLASHTGTFRTPLPPSG